jgi:nucleoid-associated protein YgaU
MKLLTSENLPTPTPGPQGNPPTFGEPKHQFTCTSPSPTAPTLFQITSVGGQATLYTAPTADQSNGYTISYGLNADADMYSVSFNYSDKSGAIPYTINYLNTNSVYYFKIRANNDCMPGSWSKILSAKTLTSSTFTSYYSPSNSFGNKSVAGTSSNNSQCTEYTVIPGDSLWTIAQKLLTNAKRYLELWNNNSNTYPSLKNSSIIRTGWKLQVGC